MHNKQIDGVGTHFSRTGQGGISDFTINILESIRLLLPTHRAFQHKLLLEKILGSQIEEFSSERTEHFLLNPSVSSMTRLSKHTHWLRPTHRCANNSLVSSICNGNRASAHGKPPPTESQIV